MAIQMRRGAYEDFDASQMLPGEWAVVLEGDEGTTDGYAVYICFAAGVVKRIVSADEVSSLSDDIYWATVEHLDEMYNWSTIQQAVSEAQAAIEAIGDIAELSVPLMSSTTRGGAKLGSGLDLDDGVLSVDPSTIELPTMSASTRGVAKLGNGLEVTDDALSVDPITTTQIDDVVSYDSSTDEPVEGDESLSTTGLAYFWGKLKTWAASTFAALSHNHSASDITSGTLSVSRGGTGLSSSPSMLTNLASTTAADVMAASPRPGVTGTLPIANGGTGATSAPNALDALLESNPLAVSKGGTGGTTAAGGRYNLLQGVSEASSTPSSSAHVVFSRGDNSSPSDVLYTRAWSTIIDGVKADIGMTSGLLTLASRTAYPLYVYTSLPSQASLPVTPCFVLDTSDYGLWFFDGN